MSRREGIKTLFFFCVQYLFAVNDFCIIDLFSIFAGSAASLIESVCAACACVEKCDAGEGGFCGGFRGHL